MLKKLITCGLLAIAPLAIADSLLLDRIDLAVSTTHLRPLRGTSMERVQTVFGTPTSQQTAIGDPPISRWDYPGFAVYFEHAFVIHAVAKP